MSYRYRYFIQLRVRRRWENALMLILSTSTRDHRDVASQLRCCVGQPPSHFNQYRSSLISNSRMESKISSFDDPHPVCE